MKRVLVVAAAALLLGSAAPAQPSAPDRVWRAVVDGVQATELEHPADWHRAVLPLPTVDAPTGVLGELLGSTGGQRA